MSAKRHGDIYTASSATASGGGNRVGENAATDAAAMLCLGSAAGAWARTGHFAAKPPLAIGKKPGNTYFPSTLRGRYSRRQARMTDESELP